MKKRDLMPNTLTINPPKMEIKRLLFILLIGISIPLHAQYPDGSYDPYDDYPRDYRTDDAIQIALILDVSGSMEGLIEQAKSQLWHIVNGINWSYDGRNAPRIELALYVYGEQGGGYRSGYVRQVVPFTTDLDWVADALYGLRTDGRYEYAGAAIQAAVTELRWSYRPVDRKMIYIAGNEVFDQGPVDSRDAIFQASRKGITVNTIYCGDDYKGRRQGWDDAAYEGGGSYMAINHNYREQYDYYRPYNDRLLGLNTRLNATYIPYGYRARTYRERQLEQDRRARRLGYGIYCERIIVKSSRAYYQPDWDLVDAYFLGVIRLEDINVNDLPPEMRGMNRREQHEFLARKARERQQIRSEIQGVAGEVRRTRPEVISAGTARPDRTPATSGRPVPQGPRTLDQAIIESIQVDRPTMQRSAPSDRGTSRTTQTPNRPTTNRQSVPTREVYPSPSMERSSSPRRDTPVRTETRQREATPTRTTTSPGRSSDSYNRSRQAPTTRQSSPSRQVEQVSPRRSTPTQQSSPRRQSQPEVQRHQSETPTVRRQTPSTPQRTAPSTQTRRSTTPARSTRPSSPEVKPTERNRPATSTPATTPSRRGGNNQSTNSSVRRHNQE